MSQKISVRTRKLHGGQYKWIIGHNAYIVDQIEKDTEERRHEVKLWKFSLAEGRCLSDGNTSGFYTVYIAGRYVRFGTALWFHLQENNVPWLTQKRFGEGSGSFYEVNWKQYDPQWPLSEVNFL